ncbi:MAG: sigma 54-dependent Fis family transcriptional regulator [Deltaproteobacteria bacterium]|nr:sigma 54-dependent Fis family transcriptional regulator [Deltaproteobacteria bacterium]
MTEQRTVEARTPGAPLRGLAVEVVAGPDQGRRLRAVSDTLSVGTAQGNDLVLTDPTVSRYHAELVRRADRIWVLDHGSTNLTSLGAVVIERAAVPPGTILRLGRTSLRIEDADPIALELSGSDRLAGLRGRSVEMRRLMAKIEKVSESDASVLVIGETGTGKEVIAHAVHTLSPRRDAPFEAVDCGTLLPTLIASELFGHERGAFTGADSQHIGAFERADGGTIFLDEIGELPKELQTALLGALERRSFRRLGGQKPISVDVRVVSATNRDLRREVNTGAFRSDLYFRLAVVSLEVPPLRERPGDVPLLVEHFLREAGYSGSIGELFPPEVMDALRAHAWPGNVRELRNYVDAALALGETSAPASLGPSSDPSGLLSGDMLAQTFKVAKDALLERFERVYLEALLARCKGNVSLAAREADMNRSYLTQVIKKHGLGR